MSKPAEKLFNKSRKEIERRIDCAVDVQCPLCGSNPSGFIPTKTVFAVDYQGFELAECAACGFRFLSCRPKRESLMAEVYESYWDDARESLKSSHRSAEIEEQMSRIESFVYLTRKSSEKIRALDVGCGNGLFLQHALERGWNVSGTEIAPRVCARLRQTYKIDIYEGYLPNIQMEETEYDVVRLNQVLEHTLDPLAELEACRRVLKPEGVLFVSVPNAGSFQYFVKDWQSRLRLKKNPYKHYAALHHFWFFTRKTLKRLCETAGFEILRWRSRVPQRPERKSLASRLYSHLLGELGVASIQDVYCRKVDRE